MLITSINKARAGWMAFYNGARKLVLTLPCPGFACRVSMGLLGEDHGQRQGVESFLDNSFPWNC